MAIAQVGSLATNNSGTTAVTTLSVTIAPVAGNCVVVLAAGRTITTTGWSVAAVGGTATFTQRVVQAGGTASAVAIFTAVNVGSGITSVTITCPSARVIAIAPEYSGVDNTTPMDVAATAGAGVSGTPQSSQSISPVTSGALVLTAMSTQSNSGTLTPFKATTAGPTAHAATNAGTGWTSIIDRWNQGGATTSINLVVAADGCNTTSGAYQCDWTLAVGATPGLGSIALRPTAAPAAFIASKPTVIGQAVKRAGTY